MSMQPLPLAEISAWHIAGLAIIGLLLFGKRLPEIGKSLGKSVTEFKKGLSGVEEDVNVSKAIHAPLPPQQQPQQVADASHVTAQVPQNTHTKA